ncbi:hypothetical protein ZWY2020_050173 [Hordeum vulgare]|nr:hypothetical protein ZWY2020_050173 [Hordeum vulgare]
MASGGAPASTSGDGAGTKTVSASLWWDPFVALCDDLDRAAASPSAAVSDALAERIKGHHAWLRGAVSMFGKPNGASRAALDVGQVVVGEHRLAVKPDLKEAALRASKSLDLDEVQSYILVKRSSESAPTTRDADPQELLHRVSLQYYLERQCLLKCIRRIFVHATCTDDDSDSADAIKQEASLLGSDEMERRLLSIIKDSLAAAFSVKSAADLTVSWLEESLIEINLILDILFLAICDNFSRCNGGLWIALCSLFRDMLSGSYDVGKFSVSAEAKRSFHHAKAQLLLILIETLDLENLLRMVHDEVSFSGGYSQYSVADILEMDIEVSRLPDFEVESGPLLLAWAVFHCLLLSLPGNNANLEIDHASYAQRTFELHPLIIYLESFISAFIASYEISYQTEDGSLGVILNIICEVYDGEESLCMQFWDKDSCVDGPIRSVLQMVEKEYPFQITDLLRFLSAVCSGTWPAQCVYNYLERMNGLTTLYATPGSVPDSVNYCDQIEIHHPISIPGMEGITLPRGTRGYILKILEDNAALVRWEFPHSGVFILLLTLAQDLYSCNYVEACDIMDLLYQMVSSNQGLCSALLHADKSLAVQKSKSLGQFREYIRIDIVKILCSSIFKYEQDGNNASIMSRTFSVLTEFLKCVPYRVFDVALECGIFSSKLNDPSSDWLLSGALARMLFAASEENGDCSSLTTSLLDFAIQVLQKGAAADDTISPFIVFSVQYIMVNHMNWKHKKYSRWKTTLKVFELVKSCIQVKPFFSKLGGIIWQMLLYDSSIHSVLWHNVCTSMQLLESRVSFSNGVEDIEDIQLVLCCGLDIIFFMLSNLPEDLMPVAPFVTLVLSSSLKPLPFITATISSMSFQNYALQVSAARALSVLCFTAHRVQPQLMENGSFLVDGSEIWRLQASISQILDKEDDTNDCLIVAIFSLLTSVTRYQPALFVSLTEENAMIQADHSNSANSQTNGSSTLNSPRSNSRLVEQMLGYIENSTEFMNSSPSLLLSVLDLLEALWEGGVQFICILDKLRSSRTFWESLSRCIRATFDHCPVDSVDTVDEKFSSRYNCQAKIFKIMSHELFLKGRLLVEAKTSNPVADGAKGQKEPFASCPSNVVCKWFDSALLEDFINHLSSNGYQKELFHRAKVASCVCVIRLITKLSTGDTASLSFSAVKKIQLISSKLLQHCAFIALLSQYSLHGYSGEQELTSLVINDLYYHIHGELEGRQITPGPFQELLCFLLEFKFFECNATEQPHSAFPAVSDNVLFDVEHTRDDLGVKLWNHPDWKPCKEVAEKMLDIMHKANLMKRHADAKLCTLRSFITFLSVYTGTSSSNELTLPDGGISATAMESAIRCACKYLQSTVDSLFPEVGTNEVLFPLLSGQVDLLLTLSRFLFHQAKQTKSYVHLYPVIVLLMRTSVKSLLVLILSLFEFIYGKDDMKDGSGDANLFGESSIISTRLLPVLCKLAENREYSDLAVGSMDLLLKGFITPNVWLPILQKHLRLQAILHKCQNGAILSTQVILNFLLTLGRTKDGAKMLQSGNIFAFLKVLLSNLSLDDSCFRNSLSSQAKDVHMWSLALAIVASLNHCMDDDVSRSSVANGTVSFLSGQVPLMSSYLSAQTVNTHQNKKRAVLQQSQTSLSALSLTENILSLLCVLAKYHFPRDTGMVQVDSELREIIIHLLAFISRGSARTGDLPNWNPSFCCPPIAKEEVVLHEDPPLIRSKHGWFRFAASSTHSTAAISAPSSAALSLVIRDKSNGDSGSVKQTRFTEMVAVQIYRIAFLIMKFLCSQAKEAVKRAGELEFVDLAHFPELPMPDILHGLQDQVVSIVTEVLAANGLSTLGGETDRVCRLLLVTLETSLYMELCVSQSCGIRPVLGRFEDFSKGIKAMLHALEKHSSLQPLVRSLAQITTLLYPGLAQTNFLTM